LRVTVTVSVGSAGSQRQIPIMGSCERSFLIFAYQLPVRNIP
jgi:hypothetical protein